MNWMASVSICSGSMPRRNQERIAIGTRASAKKEMTKPRMAKSAREAETTLAASRIAPGKSLLLPVLRRAW
jgi:hypothetical protein